MADQGMPEQLPGDWIAIQYQKPKPFRRGFVMKIRTTRISRFHNYGELELYLYEKCGGGHRTYPGGADYPDITYTKHSDPYNDENNIERRLRSEPWEDFAATVYHILIRRVEA